MNTERKYCSAAFAASLDNISYFKFSNWPYESFERINSAYEAFVPLA